MFKKLFCSSKSILKSNCVLLFISLKLHSFFRYFNGLTNTEFQISDIIKHREIEQQKKFGVPENHLSGHAFHTYSLGSSEGDVSFQFQHNVCGRRTYAEGTVDAVFFLFTRL